jgi:hypothetical protein
MGNRFRRGVLLAGLSTLALGGCKRSASEQVRRAPLAAEPEKFEFSVPSDYIAVQLRGEGSETLRAPADARVEQHAQFFSVEAGGAFALEVRFQALAPADLEAPIHASERVLQDGDLLVFKWGGGYWFVVSRELVPEWDESDRRSVTCSSAGAITPAGKSGGVVRSFSRSAVEHMVAACRTVALPELE